MSASAGEKYGGPVLGIIVGAGIAVTVTVNVAESLVAIGLSPSTVNV